jgi:8-oxo-dGTP pyrophosphatase MutT (NUDIX family)
MDMKKEERHKTITILVSFADDKPRFLTARDRRHQEWIFITGGCRRLENINPLRCALRELREETRGIINIKRGSYTYFNFDSNTRTPDEMTQDIQNGLDVTIKYHVYIIEFNISRSDQVNLIQKFNKERERLEYIKSMNLPFKRSYDENDYISFDTLEEFKNRSKIWDFINDNVICSPMFYSALNSKNIKTFNMRST